MNVTAESEEQAIESAEEQMAWDILDEKISFGNLKYAEVTKDENGNNFRCVYAYNAKENEIE